ncbi:hypothetical protein ADL21_25810 [Streptomyces albus subsp. albus]|nr:hypothetical protein ADL21_25810 [Streptomyces albus subsp. albus]
MNRQLTVQESRNALAQGVCHGRRGTIRPRRHGGPLGALVIFAWAMPRSGGLFTSGPALYRPRSGDRVLRIYGIPFTLRSGT